MRRVLLVALAGVILVGPAAPAGALPAQDPPVTFSGLWGTDQVLQTQGFVGADVDYRIGDLQDVMVWYEGGGPANADLEAAFGPRQPGFGEQPLAAVFAAAAIPALGGDRDEYTEGVEHFKRVVITMGVAALLPALGFGLVAFFRTRRRVPDEREDRLFA